MAEILAYVHAITFGSLTRNTAVIHLVNRHDTKSSALQALRVFVHDRQ